MNSPNLNGGMKMQFQRLDALDGVRGVAAAMVVLMHFLCTIQPELVFGHEAGGWQDSLSRTPLSVVWNGSFAVFIFFVLSGLVIAASAERAGAPLWLLAGKRYLRLTLPALCSTLLVWLLLQRYAGATQQFATTTNNGWLAKYYRGDLFFSQAIIDGVFNPYRFGQSYANSVLWTMQYELFGSIAIYVLYRICPRSWRAIALGTIWIGLMLSGPFFGVFMCFSAGALLYEASRCRHFDRNKAMLGVSLLVTGLLLGGLPEQPVEKTHFSFLSNWLDIFTSSRQMILGLGATAVVAGCLCWHGVARTLSAKPLRFLGRISFGVYLIHWPLMALVLLDFLLRSRLAQSELFFAAGGYLAATIVFAWLFTVAVDEPVIRLLKRTSIPQASGRLAVVYISLQILFYLLFMIFVVARLGFDWGALLVWTLAFIGQAILLPMLWQSGSAAIGLRFRNVSKVS